MRNKLFLAIAFLLVSCTGKTFPAKDESLTTTEYIAKGVPSPKRSWTSVELVAAADALKKISGANPGLLPIKDSEKSGELFARLTSAENLMLAKDSSTNLSLRLDEYMRFNNGWIKLLQLYMDPKHKMQPRGTEILYIMDFAQTLTLTGREVVEKVREERPSKEMEEGYKQTESGMVTFTKGCVITLGESESYKKEDLIYFSGRVKAFLEQSWSYHNEEARQEILVTIQDVMAKVKYEEVQNNLKALRLD